MKSKKQSAKEALIAKQMSTVNRLSTHKESFVRPVLQTQESMSGVQNTTQINSAGDTHAPTTIVSTYTAINHSGQKRKESFLMSQPTTKAPIHVQSFNYMSPKRAA